jgi:hypothetical protein
MKNVQKVTSSLLILLLVIIFHSESRAFPGAEKNADGDTGAAGNLSDACRLHFIPLTSCGTERLTGGVIDFAEPDGTFSLTLFSQSDPDGVTYEDCPYEVYGGYHSTLVVGYSAPELVGAGFALAGFTVGDRLLVGFFQFRLVTLPPVECSYLMLGMSNQPFPRVNSSLVEADGIEYYLQADRHTYALGSTVTILYRLTNKSDSVRLTGNWPNLGALQPVDIMQGDKEIWAVPATPYAATEFYLDPGESCEYTMEWEMQTWPEFELVEPGTYTVVGSVGEVSLSVDIEIRNYPAAH